MAELILHHYDISSFSEKIRLIFGLKGLAWRSVIIPATLPKPDYLALTGGYRHTPSLQIGADIFCDTRLISAELERHFPTPSLFPEGQLGLIHALAAWAEGNFFWACARAVVGANAQEFPQDFHADRAAMRGKSAPALVRTQQAGAEAESQLRAVAPQVENLIARGTPFLLGAAPSLADFALYHGLWFLDQFPRRCRSEFFGAPVIDAWMRLVARVGHGARTEMSALAALEIARTSSPEKVDGTSNEANFQVGARLSVEPLERTSAPVQGRLLSCDDTRITLQREDSRAGKVNVHFPRCGYRLRVS